MAYDPSRLPGQFQPQIEGSPSAPQWDTRPGFTTAQERVGGYALGAEASFMGLAGVLSPRVRDARLGARALGALPEGIVTDPQGSLGVSRVIGGETLITTNSPDSVITSDVAQTLPGIVTMTSKEQKAFNERYGVDPKTGSMSKKGFALYQQDQQQARSNSRGWSSHTEAARTETGKNNAWAQGARGGGRRAQEQVRGGTSQTPSGPVRENHDGTRRLFSRKKDND